MILLQETLANPLWEGWAWLGKIDREFFIRLGVDLLAITVLTRGIYHRHYRRTDLFLTFFSSNIVIFMMTFLLNQVEFSMGAAFGLFAIFSMLRYRAEGISPKDMAYIFLVIGLGLISAITVGPWPAPVLLCGIVLLLTHLLESGWVFRKEITRVIHYENIRLITPDKRPELLDDLRTRTGFNVHRVEIREVDFLKDSALLTIFFYEK
ncbi:MAG: DUF4956 domain-containing protein [Bernardetiaceae bacterium]|jgi:hypothetical protein|nr:DUF4956 domain-containing protein [Bernardetiaceae bacterium]